MHYTCTKMPYNYELVEEPDLKLPGFNLSRREWRLNRFRYGQGRSHQSPDEQLEPNGLRIMRS